MKISKKPLLELTNDCEEYEWYDYMTVLGELVKKRFSEKGYVKVEAKNMGWRRASAWKVIKIMQSPVLLDLGESLMLGIAPSCTWNATVYSMNGRGLYINIRYHDNPVNGDEYYVTPIAERTYNRLKRY